MVSAIAKLRVDYVVPQPHWHLSHENGSLKLNEDEILNVVNAFLKLHSLGQVAEDWTVMGRAFVHIPQRDINKKEFQK